MKWKRRLFLLLFPHLWIIAVVSSSSFANQHDSMSSVSLWNKWLFKYLFVGVDFKILVLTLRAFHGQAPQYISDLLEPCSSYRNLTSSGQTAGGSSYKLQDAAFKKQLKMFLIISFVFGQTSADMFNDFVIFICARCYMNNFTCLLTN